MPQRYILFIVMLIFTTSTIAKWIFEGFTLKSLILFIAAGLIVLFLWKKGK